MLLTGESDYQKAAELLMQSGVKIVVVTLGKTSAYVQTRQGGQLPKQGSRCDWCRRCILGRISVSVQPLRKSTGSCHNRRSSRVCRFRKCCSERLRPKIRSNSGNAEYGTGHGAIERREVMSMNLQDNATGFQHIGFPTNDLQETIAFYEKLGFSVALRTYNEEAGEVIEFSQIL